MVVSEADDAAVEHHLDGALDDGQREQEPFARAVWLSESILDLDVEARVREEPMQQMLKFLSVKVDGVIRPHGMDWRHQERWIVLRAADAIVERSGREADLE